MTTWFCKDSQLRKILALGSTTLMRSIATDSAVHSYYHCFLAVKRLFCISFSKLFSCGIREDPALVSSYADIQSSPIRERLPNFEGIQPSSRSPVYVWCSLINLFITFLCRKPFISRPIGQEDTTVSLLVLLLSRHCHVGVVV